MSLSRLERMSVVPVGRKIGEAARFDLRAVVAATRNDRRIGEFFRRSAKFIAVNAHKPVRLMSTGTLRWRLHRLLERACDMERSLALFANASVAMRSTWNIPGRKLRDITIDARRGRVTGVRTTSAIAMMTDLDSWLHFSSRNGTADSKRFALQFKSNNAIAVDASQIADTQTVDCLKKLGFWVAMKCSEAPIVVCMKHELLSSFSNTMRTAGLNPANDVDVAKAVALFTTNRFRSSTLHDWFRFGVDDSLIGVFVSSVSVT